MKKKSTIYIVSIDDKAFRLDLFLSLRSHKSRSQIIYFIENNFVLINNSIVSKKSKILKIGDIVEVFEQELIEKKKKIDIPILFENKNFFVINKPPFICTHARNKLDNQYSVADMAKIYWNDKDGEIYRYGLVHRIDKDTSGILIIAKNILTYEIFQKMFKEKIIKKFYIAYTEKKNIQKEGIIRWNIMRDPLIPVQMTWSLYQGKEALTEYKIIDETDQFNIVICSPHTGRTHQIRVHMQSLNTPIIGDLIYGKRSDLIDRQALHAYKISFTIFDEKFLIEAPLYQDMQRLYNIIS